MEKLAVLAFITVICLAILVLTVVLFSSTVVNLFTSAASLEKMKTIDNSNIGDNFYDNFQGSIYRLTDGQTSPNGKWEGVYSGDGSMGVARDNTTSRVANNYFFEQPKTSTRYNDTHASLVTTTKAFSDFRMTLDMKTVRQLRQNSPPAPWETAWIFWHYTDKFHYYGLVLKTTGFQIEKKDNNVKCDGCEIYLVDVSNPKVKLNQWQTITLRVTGSATNKPHIKVWVDGDKAADFVDKIIHQPNSPQMSGGYIGLYNEDSLVSFNNVKINTIK